MVGIVGTGVTITHATTGFTATLIGAVEGDGIEREAIDVTNHADTAYKSYIPGKLQDLGEVTLEILFDPDEQPPVGSAAETITITFPIDQAASPVPSSGATLQFTGFVTSWNWSAPLEEEMTAEYTIKLDGGTYTWTDAS